MQVHVEIMPVGFKCVCLGLHVYLLLFSGSLGSMFEQNCRTTVCQIHKLFSVRMFESFESGNRACQINVLFSEYYINVGKHIRNYKFHMWHVKGDFNFICNTVHTVYIRKILV